MGFVSEKIEDYVEKHSQKEPELLRILEDRTFRRVLNPRMCSGAFQGRLLSMISRLVRPSRILEIGTYTGYSALCLAEGLARDGKLITVDKNPEIEDMAREFFALSPYGKQIEMIVGDALRIIPSLEGEFDLVFIDADKINYVNYFHQVIDKISKGGVLLSDNVLWSGKVVEPLSPKDKDTRVLLEYNRILAEDTRLQTLMLPVRDGITISIKL